MHATRRAAQSKATVARRTWAWVGSIILWEVGHIIGDGPGCSSPELAGVGFLYKEFYKLPFQKADTPFPELVDAGFSGFPEIGRCRVFV